jgi:hypothetical protein
LPRLVNTESEEAKEMRKWEAGYTEWGAPGRPYVYQEYPKMLYKARRFRGAGEYMVFKDIPEYEAPGWGRADAENWSRQNYCIVRDAQEYARMRSQGWSDTQEQAIARCHALDKEISTAAAERAYQDRNMSEPAKREIAAAEEAADGRHLAEVERTPVRKKRPYNRKPKTEAQPN